MNILITLLYLYVVISSIDINISQQQCSTINIDAITVAVITNIVVIVFINSVYYYCSYYC